VLMGSSECTIDTRKLYSDKISCTLQVDSSTYDLITIIFSLSSQGMIVLSLNFPQLSQVEKQSLVWGTSPETGIRRTGTIQEMNETLSAIEIYSTEAILVWEMSSEDEQFLLVWKYNRYKIFFRFESDSLPRLLHFSWRSCQLKMIFKATTRTVLVSHERTPIPFFEINDPVSPQMISMP
jgi:hypothetical protein